MATLRALECLVALVDTGSVSAAAASLHLSQPALSHQIASLEKEMGVAVVERLWRGVRPTAAGRAAADEARVALRTAAEAIAVGRRVGTGDAGRLRILCAETMTAWLLVPVLRQWRIHRPDVTLELGEHTSADDMVERLSAGTADVIVGPCPTRTDEHVERIGQEEMVVVSSSLHRFARQESISVPDLAGEPFVHFTHDNGMAAWVDELTDAHGVVLDAVLRTRSPRTAAQLAAAGMGVTVVPVSALNPRPTGTVRPLNPRVLRDIVATIAAPSDALVRRFVSQLVQRGLPETARV